MMDSHDKEQQFIGHLTEIQVPLRLYVSSLMPGDSSAKDVIQNANTTLWRKRNEYEPGTFFKAWAFSIARYEVLNYRKKVARESRLVFGEDLENAFAEELSEHSDDLEQRHEALKHCLEKLRPTHRELLLHRYSSDGTLKDFSEKTGNSIGGLKVTLHRLRNALQGCIEKQLNLGEANS
ncbi:sigma-70 family RNA polymerase sigma factor [Luteolibacter algae]|uniref:Sigma-70 family RNA polymerase sigma factor n=1 Tax=Luteolibacter algae TaxID=454151 RepID=A0ABW5D9M9_9BACT